MPSTEFQLPDPSATTWKEFLKAVKTSAKKYWKAANKNQKARGLSRGRPSMQTRILRACERIKESHTKYQTWSSTQWVLKIQHILSQQGRKASDVTIMKYLRPWMVSALRIEDSPDWLAAYTLANSKDFNVIKGGMILVKLTEDIPDVKTYIIKYHADHNGVLPPITAMPHEYLPKHLLAQIKRTYLRPLNAGLYSWLINEFVARHKNDEDPPQKPPKKFT